MDPTTIPRLRFQALPRRWIEGAPLGNGELGVMAWADGSRLRFTLDSASAWDLRGESHPARWPYKTLRDLVERRDFETLNRLKAAGVKPDPLRPRKLFLGRFELDAVFEPDCDLRLTLGDARLAGALRSAAGVHALAAFVARTDDLFALRVAPWPDGAALRFRPFDEVQPDLAALGHPAVERSRAGALELAVQQFLPGAFFCVCWNPVGPDILAAVGRGASAADARRRALEKRAAAEPLGLDGLGAAHAAAWRAFWSSSSVALPERDLEFLWHFAIYLLGSAARPGSLPPGLGALWPNDANLCPWRGAFFCNINHQEMFWPAAPSGHLELLDVWLDHLHAALPAAEAFTRDVFGTRGAFMVCAFMPGYVRAADGCWDPFGLAWSNTGFLAELAWQRWRFSLDRDWLRGRGYPLIRSAFLFYADNLVREADGLYHVPLSSSPEYLEGTPESWARDPTIDLALIRRCCDWIAEMEQALGMDELTARAREIRGALPPYPLAAFGPPLSGNARPSREPCVLELWPGRPLDRSHRHPSHLMPIHPAMDLTIEGSETERRIIDYSLLQYLALGSYFWHTHTYGQMVSLAAVVGRGEMAGQFARTFRDTNLLPNAVATSATGYKGTTYFTVPRPGEPAGKDLLHYQAGPARLVIDATCGVARGLSDMLLQGWRDTLRVFPALPGRWADALFVDLLAEGAFRVSALKRDGAVRWVRIRAGVERRCRLRNPFGDQPFQASGADPQRAGGNRLEWAMKASQVVTLFTAGYERPDLEREQARIRAMDLQVLNVERGAS